MALLLVLLNKGDNVQCFVVVTPLSIQNNLDRGSQSTFRLPRITHEVHVAYTQIIQAPGEQEPLLAALWQDRWGRGEGPFLGSMVSGERKWLTIKAPFHLVYEEVFSKTSRFLPYLQPLAKHISEGKRKTQIEGNKYRNILKPWLWSIGPYWVENNPPVINVSDVRIISLLWSAFFCCCSFLAIFLFFRKSLLI